MTSETDNSAEEIPGALAMTPALMERVALRFRALSDPNRLQLLQLIIAGERSVNGLADAAGLSLANASKHLAMLCSAGFIKRTKDGTRAIYSVTNTTPRILCELVCRDVRSQVERELASTSFEAKPERGGTDPS